MPNEKGEYIYRRLIYFFENKKRIHFKDSDGIFYNGIILDLSEKKLTMVLQERIRGIIPILLECINPNSIQEFKEKEKKE